MPELTNLTDRIAHLRDRKARPLAAGSSLNKPQKTQLSGANRERSFAADYFGLFVYSLLGIALLAQILLIVWLDLF
ncbi:MAG: hypothetical protein ACI81V_000888 [Lentimonas sp.]|jgi:hypothetical protein